MNMNKWLVPTLFTIAIIAVIFFAVRAVTSSNNDSSAANQASPTPSLSQDEKAGLKQGQTFGQTNNPKVVLTEFGDLQCPACKLYEPTMRDIRAKYADKVEIVFKHFPLNPTPHKNALTSAYAAEAAANQGKFWEMHDKLYDTQDDWGLLDNPKAKYVEYVTALGLNVDQFKRDYDGEAGKDNITRDKALGTKLQLKGTPSFYLNGELTDTSGGPDAMLKQIQDLIK